MDDPLLALLDRLVSRLLKSKYASVKLCCWLPPLCRKRGTYLMPDEGISQRSTHAYELALTRFVKAHRSDTQLADLVEPLRTETALAEALTCGMCYRRGMRYFFSRNVSTCACVIRIASDGSFTRALMRCIASIHTGGS